MNAKGLEHIEGKTNVKKETLVRLNTSQLPNTLPEFKHSKLTKDLLIAQWLKNWIINDLANGSIKPKQLLPKKEDIAAYLGISTGTIQNAIRYIEDAGLVESKQRIGTMIKDKSDNTNILRKQTSKRDNAVEAIIQLIQTNKYKPGDNLPSSREISKIIGSAPNTTRLALEYLSSIEIIKAMNNRGNKANWQINSIPDSQSRKTNISIESTTLVNKVEEDLKKYIEANFEVGDKMPAHAELSEVLKVSIKTVHDAVKTLIKEKILSAKRGRYGTTILKMPSDKTTYKPENTIFASAEEAVFYNYERIERHLKNMISNNYKIGDKLPSMSTLSKNLDVSGNTIRKALQNLAKECIVEFARGKYGGTFIVNMPKVQEKQKTFTWLSVNPEHIKAYRTPETVK